MATPREKYNKAESKMDGLLMRLIESRWTALIVGGAAMALVLLLGNVC